MTWYLYLRPLQEPYNSGVAASGRHFTFSFDVMSYQEPSSLSLQEIGELLEDAGVGVLSSTILLTSRAATPNVPAITLLDAGGLTDVSVQDTTERRFQQLVTRVIASALDENDARVLSWAAYNALQVVRNQEV